MCMANMTDKIRLMSPVSKKLEQKTGLRPHGFANLIGIGGKRDGNLFYKKGGAGYAGEQQYTNNYEQPAHSRSIAARKAKGL